jgi:glycosyltransferase involved in cell wall biosynthesis
MAAGNHDSIDVIIPARGTTPWLELSLSSIASQSFQPAAIFLIDDGLAHVSSSEDLGQKLFGRRFHLLKNKGQGISAALNTGIQRSNARWVARMDTDDMAHPDRFKMQLDFLSQKSPGVIGCGTQVRFINSKGTVLGHSHLPIAWPQIHAHIIRRTCFVHSTLLIKREVLLTIPYRPSMDGAEDVDLILRLSERGEFLNLDACLLDYRLHPTQESFRARAQHTAVQELAFRLALSRKKTNSDPLENTPGLAKGFINWRLSDSAYVRSRTFLTALRYAKIYLGGLDLNGFGQTALVGLRSLPTTWASLYISWLIFRKAGAALLQQSTPFTELNIR